MEILSAYCVANSVQVSAAIGMTALGVEVMAASAATTPLAPPAALGIAAGAATAWAGWTIATSTPVARVCRAAIQQAGRVVRANVIAPQPFDVNVLERFKREINDR